MPQQLPPSQPSTSRYILTALAIILVVTTFILVGLNALNLQQRFGIRSDAWPTAMKGYRDGYLAARTKYEGLCPMVNQRTSSISGIVVNVAANSFTIKQTSLDTDANVDGVEDVRTIAMTPQTQIVKITPKNPDQLASEQAKFIESSKTQRDVVPPSPVTQQTIAINDVKAGQTVFIQSTMQDVRLESTIYAQTITVKE